MTDRELVKTINGVKPYEVSTDIFEQNAYNFGWDICRTKIVGIVKKYFSAKKKTDNAILEQAFEKYWNQYINCEGTFIPNCHRKSDKIASQKDEIKEVFIAGFNTNLPSKDETIDKIVTPLNNHE